MYTEREAEAVPRYLAANKAIEERGPIDREALAAGALPADTPGFSATLPVTEAMVRYNNSKYDPDNPLLHDADYARSLGYKDILAMPCFGAHDDTFMVPYPPEARDTLLVSQLNHSVTNYAPVYPGDTLYLIADKRSVIDRSPVEGSVYRHVTLASSGSVYNQRGEKINDTTWRVTESEKIYKPGKRPEKMGFIGDVGSARLDGAARPTSTPTPTGTSSRASGPRSTAAVPSRSTGKTSKSATSPPGPSTDPSTNRSPPPAPTAWGAGAAAPCARRSWTRRSSPPWSGERATASTACPTATPTSRRCPTESSPSSWSTRATDELDAAVDTPGHPQAGADRAALINFLGRDLAIRHLNNWMGDRGWLYNIRWGIMPAEAHAALGKIVPKDPGAEYFLGKAPSMAGKHMSGPRAHRRPGHREVLCVRQVRARP